MSRLLGKALKNYLEQGFPEEIIILNSLGEEEIMSTAYFFRSYDEMPALEQKALDTVRGSILDIGAGAGSHSLYLQEHGHLVTALDSSPDAIACCLARGIKNAICKSIMAFSNGSFDTLLLLMNGIGVAGSLERLEPLLTHLRSLLNPEGQILLDSSDIRYMYEQDEMGPVLPDKPGTYYGDILFSVYYKGTYEAPFPWVYVDYENLAVTARRCGFRAEKIMDGPHFDYLARLTCN